MKNNSILFVLGRVDSFAAYLRGLLWRVLYFHNAKRLRVCGGCRFRGKIELGNNVYIGAGCSLEMAVKIGSDTTLGRGVSCMCHGGNTCVIGERCTINQNTLLIGKVTIGNDCMIAGNSVVAGANHCFARTDVSMRSQGLSCKGIWINDDVWIGGNVSIVDGVTIGRGAVIGAGTVVTKDIPEYAVAIGNPAKVVKMRQSIGSKNNEFEG